MVFEDDRRRPDAFHSNLPALTAYLLIEVASDLSSSTSFTDW
jgi:hypothetical protein